MQFVCCSLVSVNFFFFFFFQAEDGIRDVERSRGLGDVYKRQYQRRVHGVDNQYSFKNIQGENMLQFIRNRASGWIVKFILSLIIVVFIFFGWGTYKSGQMNQIASVNGEVITPGEYRTAYNYILGIIKDRFGGNISPEILEVLQVEKQALNRLIQEKIILQKAREHNLMVSDKELADYIFSQEYFLTGGKFDEKKIQASFECKQNVC
eukprot:TRINITY_DN17629_c0_g2_i1.p1 TRINITY_DN17629_c0_g2~~TRINITY_DN17629_c0_g2_i1.p1  ORF type:complete len:208 (-),score=45.50 TRINITY_DN17629_c0_g2_i1:209-832(-)